MIGINNLIGIFEEMLNETSDITMSSSSSSDDRSSSHASMGGRSHSIDYTFPLSVDDSKSANVPTTISRDEIAAGATSTARFATVEGTAIESDTIKRQGEC